MEEYEYTRHKLELLRLFVQGEKEIEAGKGFELEAVLAEAEVLLTRKHC